jgi:uncharacterized protein with PhoU and TrkA domain
MPALDAVLDSLHIRMLYIEPGSFAEGKTLGDLDLKARFGIADYGFWRDNATDNTSDEATRLQAGDVLIVFVSDKTGEEMAGLFCCSRD